MRRASLPIALLLAALFAVHSLLWAAAPVDTTERTISDSERDHWAYRPIPRVTVPQVDDPRWAGHPIDRFLFAEMQARGVAPLPAVSQATLLRRVYFDLTGLPPTPQQVLDFLNDQRPDAFERTVDRLLDSPAYGERWAQHWLDLARFAETDGFEFDHVRPHAWRYRDWVIDALNRDLPFDEFLRQQIAGDLLDPDDPAAAVATGFLLSGPDMPDLNLVEERRHLVLNEMAATVGAVVLGLQIGCAQCHDHKFDPITQHDFFRLRAFFESAELFRDHPIPTPAEAAARRTAEAAWTPQHRQQEQRRQELEKLGRQRLRETNPDDAPTPERIVQELDQAEREELAELTALLDALPPLPDLPLGRVMREGDPQPSYLYHRGDFRQPGAELNPGFPQLLREASSESAPRSRVDLANWLTHSEHPLTARVMGNRLWQWHFGSGLSETPSDFGLMGDEPNHAELLDWLARHFVDAGWSLKATHRLIVTSQAYRLASAPYDAGWSQTENAAAESIWTHSASLDPDNHSWWRRRPMRLEGEAVRDAMLFASQTLSQRRGGPGIRPPLPPEVTATLLKNQWNVSGDDEDHRRRSVYIFVRRNLSFPLFGVFDRPDGLASCAQRHQSTTAPQALVLLNSQFSLQCATDLAGLLLDSPSDDSPSRIEQAYLRTLGRYPTTSEIDMAGEFLISQAERLRDEARTPDQLAAPATGRPVDPYAAAALVDLCLALFNSNEFLYVD